jgi:hypothetical protein
MLRSQRDASPFEQLFSAVEKIDWRYVCEGPKCRYLARNAGAKRSTGPKQTAAGSLSPQRLALRFSAGRSPQAFRSNATVSRRPCYEV